MSFQNISDEDGKTLVKMARTVVTEYLTNNIKILNEDFKEKFSFSAGVFVTINDKSGLRGCIGFPLAVKKLSNALTDAAISASTEDPRFPSITQNEIIQEIKIGRDGLIIENEFQSGLLLPQVPVEYNWNIEDFLKHTCHKAGLPSDSWKDKTTKISKFQGVIFRELLPNGEIIREKFQ